MVESEPSSSARAHRVAVVDYMRLAAAVAVVCFHYLYNGIKNGKIDSISHDPIAAVARYGYLGVDLFFMISGFVILASVTGKTAHKFAVGRALRLYPAFWVALVVTTVFAFFLGGSRMGVDPVQFQVNTTMVPSLFGQPFVDGVYWTLLYEVQFYVLVFVLVLFRQGHRLAALMPAWAILMHAVTLANSPFAHDTPYLGGYFAWFAAGAIIASIARSGWSAYRAWGLLAAYLTTTPLELNMTSALKTLCFLLILSTLIPAVRDLKLPGSKMAGALTYPLYLLHAHIGYMLISRFADESNKWVVYTAVTLLIFGMAYGLHVFVERNPTARRFWSWLFEGTLGRLVDLLQALVDRVLPTISRGGSSTPQKPAPVTADPR